MTIISALGEAALVLLAIAAAGVGLAVMAAAILVTIAVHAEERRGTLAGPAPGPVTRLARRVLAAPAYGTGQQPRSIARRQVARPARTRTATALAVPPALEELADSRPPLLDGSSVSPELAGVGAAR